MKKNCRHCLSNMIIRTINAFVQCNTQTKSKQDITVNFASILQDISLGFHIEKNLSPMPPICRICGAYEALFPAYGKFAPKIRKIHENGGMGTQKFCICPRAIFPTTKFSITKKPPSIFYLEAFYTNVIKIRNNYKYIMESFS